MEPTKMGADDENKPLKISHTKAKVSPSLIMNNLTSSACGTYVAFISRNDAHVMNRADMDNERVPTALASPEDGKTMVSALRYCTLNKTEVLVVTNLAGVIYVFSAAGDQQLYKAQLRHEKDGKESPAPLRSNRITCIAGKGKTLVVGTCSGNIHVFSMGPKGFFWKGTVDHKHGITSLALTSAGVIIAGDEMGNVVFFDASGDKQIGGSSKGVTHEGQGVPCTTLSYGHGWLAAGYGSGHIRLFDLKEFKLRIEIAAHSRSINAMTFTKSNNKCRLACASEDSFMSVWAVATADSSKLTVSKVLMESPNSGLLTGICFMGESETKVGCATYDSRYISMATVS